MENYEELEKQLGYVFMDKNLLKTAFTHTTYVFEHNMGHYSSNQRLEYIGDAVIDLVIGRKLYDMDEHADEGFLSKTRSIIVCERSFAEVARSLRFGDYLLLGKGERQTGGVDKDSTLADAFEAVIAAIYFDGGFDEASRVILSVLNDIICKAYEGKLILDYKSRIYEIAQQRGNQHKIRFEVLDERGPAHEKEFDVACYADDTLLSKATGRSKKDAEQKCAEAAIKVYERLFVKAGTSGSTED